MSTVMDFLLENDISGITAEVKVSDRIPHKFKIRPMTPKEKNAWRRRCQPPVKGKSGACSFDSGKFSELTIINCTLDPNFRSEDFINKSSAATPEDLLNKVLLAGEIDELHEQICRLSGFAIDGSDDATEDGVEEAKNL